MEFLQDSTFIKNFVKIISRNLITENYREFLAFSHAIVKKKLLHDVYAVPVLSICGRKFTFSRKMIDIAEANYLT